MTAPPRYRCATCGLVSAAWAPMERHVDAEHHHRIDVAVTKADEPPGSTPASSTGVDPGTDQHNQPGAGAPQNGGHECCS